MTLRALRHFRVPSPYGANPHRSVAQLPAQERAQQEAPSHTRSRREEAERRSGGGRKRAVQPHQPTYPDNKLIGITMAKCNKYYSECLLTCNLVTKRSKSLGACCWRLLLDGRGQALGLVRPHDKSTRGSKGAPLTLLQCNSIEKL